MSRALIDPRRIRAHLLAAGGWHTHEEICDALGAEHRILRASVSGSLTVLARAGAVAKRRGRSGEIVYGVTARCKPLEDACGYVCDRVAGRGGGGDPAGAAGVGAA
jgi:hypothetical protein